jgi:hypothetical protein
MERQRTIHQINMNDGSEDYSDSESDPELRQTIEAIMGLGQDDVNWISIVHWRVNINTTITMIQLGLSLVLIAFSLYKLFTTTNEALVTIYTSMLCGILGFLLPNPNLTESIRRR